MAEVLRLAVMPVPWAGAEPNLCFGMLRLDGTFTVLWPWAPPHIQEASTAFTWVTSPREPLASARARAERLFVHGSHWVWRDSRGGSFCCAGQIEGQPRVGEDPKQLYVRIYNDFAVPLWPHAAESLMRDPRDFFDPVRTDWVPDRFKEKEKAKASPQRYPWLPFEVIAPWGPVMAAQGVSAVARSKRGFLAAYHAAGGQSERMDPAWHRKRDAFLARHLAQRDVREEELYKAGQPTRRHLALVAWAYSPDRLFHQRKVNG
jgi:hypothetical protein